MDDLGSGEGILESVKNVAGSVASAVGEEFSKVGQTAMGQVTGRTPAPTDEEIANRAKKDKNFSKKGEVEVKARINAIYQEYAAKQKKAQMGQEAQKQQVEQQQEETQDLQKQQKNEEIELQVERSKAETGKNYGAE